MSDNQGFLGPWFEKCLENFPATIYVVEVSLEPKAIRFEKIKFLNREVEHLTGWSIKEIKADPYWWFKNLHPEDQPKTLELKEKLLKDLKRGELFYRFRKKDGFYIGTRDCFSVISGRRDRFLIAGLWLDLKREKSDFFDPVTGLPNRELFLEKLKVLLAKARRRKEGLVVVVLDLAKFREVNSTLGFKGGDIILKQVGERLKENLREGDIKSRFFADHFGLALTEVKTPYGVWMIMEKLRNIFKKPFRVYDQEIYMSANFGAAFFPKDGLRAGELLRKAEIALKRAKESGEGCFGFYSPGMEKELLEEAFFRNALMEGLKHREFFLEYQPILDLRTQRVIGVEALIRWRHSTLGLISPAKFIPVAEKSGLIFELGDFVLSKSLEEMAALSLSDLFLALNLSGRQFRDPSLALKIETALKNSGFPPERLVLEITETSAMEDAQKTKHIISTLRKIGIKIALDDFGIGYSSMQYLIELEVDKIKIDRSFVTAILESEKALKVTDTVIELSHRIGVPCLAEGIENEEQLKKLVDLGCDEGQGFYFSRPMRLESLEEFLSRCGR